MRKFKWIFVLALLGAIAGGSGVWAADAVNWSVTKLKVEDTAYIKTLYLGGDPKFGSNGTAMTATGAELNYLDITTLGTGAASKAVVLDTGEDYTWPATGILKLGVVKDVANTTLTSTFAELNALASAGLSNAEATVLGGIAATLTAAELNILDGVTSTAAELNYNDVAAAGTAEASKSAVLDGSKSITGLGPVGVTGDVTLTQGNGGTGNDVNAFVGVPKMAPFALGASVNGTTNTVGPAIFIDETPDGEWTATANVTDSAEGTIFRKGTASLKLAVGATPAAGNGADNTLGGGDQDWSADESVGVWVYCTATAAAGDWVLEITDSVAGATTVNFPAITTANKWQWCEIDISGVADASKDVITDIAIDLSAAGAISMVSQSAYFDFMAKWDGADEETLGLDVQQDGVVGLWATVTAAGQANTPVVLVEGTDYIIHYQSGNDSFVAVSDQSANSIWGFAATN